MISAALKRIEELREDDQPEFDSIYDGFAHFYQQRLDLLTPDGHSQDQPPGSGARTQARERYRSIGGELRSAERSALLSLHARSEIGDSEIRSLEHELDLFDLRASGAQSLTPPPLPT